MKIKLRNRLEVLMKDSGVNSFEDGLAAALPTTGAGRDKAGHRPLADQAVLELGERAKEVKDQPTTAAVGVDGFGERSEADAALVKVVDDLDQVLQRPREAVELPDHQRVALAHRAQAGGQLRPLAELAGCLLLEQLLAAGATERVKLQLRVLVLRTHAGIADDHQTYLGCTLIVLRHFLRSG